MITAIIEEILGMWRRASDLVWPDDPPRQIVLVALAYLTVMALMFGVMLLSTII